jgi:RimJ/RimL family protein N-acetyltransferase
MGIGSALIDQALQWAREHPTLRRIHLYVLTRNLGAIRLYQRHGFQVEGYMHDAYYLVEEGVYVDSLIMALSVK